MLCAYARALQSEGITDARSMSSRAMAEMLRARLYATGKSSVGDHRNGDCMCDNEATPGNVKHTPTTGRILIIDIERVPGTAHFWDAKTRYIGANSVVSSPRTVCFAARWYGDKTPIFEAEWIDRDQMVRKAWELYDEAAAVVTFNGARFDNNHLRGEWLAAGMAPPRPWKDIDLFRTVRTQFGYEHRGLDAVCKRLGAPGKTDKYDVQVALDACAGNPDAQERIRGYNIGDIEATEWLYDRLRGWMPGHPFIGSGDAKRCNQCGSADLKAQPTQYRAVVMDYALYRCNHCGANIRAGWTARTSDTRGVA